MNTRSTFALALLSIFISQTFAAGPVPGCGTHNQRTAEELYLHRQAQKARGGDRTQRMKALSAAAVTTNRDYGHVAVIDGGDGVIAKRNQFNLNRRTVQFTPSAADAARYRVQVGDNTYDSALPNAGAKVELDDDDSRPYPLPFSFPFYGARYRSVYLNSDGNLTFGGGFTLTERSLGMHVGGRPRISPLFTDLDPTVARGNGGVYVTSDSTRFVVTWRSVPLYSDFGYGTPQTFQLRLHADGRIEFAYSDVSVFNEAVVGIAPGASKGTLALVSFVANPSGEYSGAVADRFSGIDNIDMASAAQKFYATHDDAYDYLVFFNSAGVAAGDSAVAYEVTVRNQRSGYGDGPMEAGADFGSKRRLQAVMNMGPLYQYPEDPQDRVPSRGSTGDTVLSVLAHEAGHLFLAFASVRDPEDPYERPMLGRAFAHWAFTFNSEASVLEGNRIADSGESASPRFRTTETVEGFSALDQYLMGLRAPEEVPPTFFVTQASIGASRAPQVGMTFNGRRQNVLVDDIIAAEGRRTPDHTVAQRRFRFAFVLVVEPGTTPPQEQVAKVEAFRAAFESYFAKATANRASADTTLNRGVQVSAFPAAGIVANSTGTITITLDQPAVARTTFLLSTTRGAADVPASVVIVEGADRVSFPVRGIREGVEELLITPSDTSYETVQARIQVARSTSDLKLELVSYGEGVPVVVRVTDINRLPYSGVSITARVNGGTLSDPVAVSDVNGEVRFAWSNPQALGTFEANIGGSTVQPVALRLTGRPSTAANAIVNAASYVPGLTPGGLVSIFGSGLSGGQSAQANLPLPYGLANVQVLINGLAARLLYVSDGQINILVPSDLAGDRASVEVENPFGRSAPVVVPVSAASPGVFAIVVSGTGQTTATRAIRAGDYLEIYATAIGRDSPTVMIGNTSASVVYAGPHAIFPGLFQINARVPAGLARGDQSLAVVSEGIRSNTTPVRVE
jgi:uncharacterized protein (TIGR03437 family)